MCADVACSEFELCGFGFFIFDTVKFGCVCDDRDFFFDVYGVFDL